MTAPATLEVMPIFNRIMDTLPEAIRTGKKTFYWKDRESKLLFLRFLDNTGYNFVRQVFARWIGVPELGLRTGWWTSARGWGSAPSSCLS